MDDPRQNDSPEGDLDECKKAEKFTLWIRY